MPRDLSSPLVTSFTGNQVALCILADLGFASGTAYAWSGIGTLAWNGNSYAGVGSLGAVGDIAEGVEVRANGTTVQLSGIPTSLMTDAQSEIQTNLPATIYVGAFDQANGSLIDAYPMFKGTIDKSQFEVGGNTFSVTLNLELRMLNFQRASNRRYTSADQNRDYPDDPFFNFVELLHDQTLEWM